METLKYDVMLSYCWAQKETVHKISEELISRNIHVWIDKEEMNSGSIYQKMMEGVTNSKIFIPFISEDYKSSHNCEREISFAADQNKEFIPVRTEPNTKPDETDLIIAGKLYFTFYEGQDFDENFAKLYDAIMETLSRYRNDNKVKCVVRHYQNGAPDNENDYSIVIFREDEANKESFVVCEEKEHGCQWTGPEHDYEDHEKVCEHKVIRCDFTGCLYKAPRKKFEVHYALSTNQHLKLLLQNTTKELAETKTALQRSQAKQNIIEQNYQSLELKMKDIEKKLRGPKETPAARTEEAQQTSDRRLQGSKETTVARTQQPQETEPPFEVVEINTQDIATRRRSQRKARLQSLSMQ